MGWRLKGIPSIERVSPGRGLPFFDGDYFSWATPSSGSQGRTSDVFVLGGDELVPCTTATGQAAATSPSCAAGAEWVTKTEKGLRIDYDVPSNRWTVTQPDGTRLIFVSVWEAMGKAGANPYPSTDPLYGQLYQLGEESRWLLWQVDDGRKTNKTRT